MPKRQSRPWDKGIHFKERLAQIEAVLAVPSLEVDGVVFKSDRFYLHALEDEHPELPSCQCGSKEAPPLFPREAFLKSLDLKAAIFGTYSLDLQWLSSTFPNLFGPSSTVPTLILHGNKGGLAKQLQDPQEEQGSTTMPESEDQENSEPTTAHFRMPASLFPTTFSARAEDDASSVDGGGSLKTQEDFMASPLALSKINGSLRSPLQSYTTDQTVGPRALFSPPRKDNNNPSKASLGQHCHLTQILSAWTPPTGSSKVSREETNDKNKQARETKKGVHHPKVMLLFETSGDLVMVVSTANLVQTQTLEGSWIQRFRGNRRRPLAMPTCSDFGPVLVDFLEKVSLAATPGQTTVQDFLTRYMSMDGLADLALRYHFEKAQVHLVPVIPGNWRGKCKKNQRFLYGRQRVQDVLSKIPDLMQSKKDQLLLQPTSFGGNWKQAELADVVRSYLGYTRAERPREYWNETALLNRLRIVWPTNSYIRSIQPRRHSANDDEADPHPILFLSSQFFNSCDQACIARMAWFKPSRPIQRPPLIPHFKSVARLCRPPKDCPSADHFFSWFLLTSACFSLGAQGKGVATFEKKDIPVEYANFELGVLFTSKSAASRRTSDRMYCFLPAECSCEQGVLSGSSRLVHLPVPYCLHTQLYMTTDDEENGMMQETPFFHEIEEGNRCVGNMLLTPYGREQQLTMGAKNASKC